MSIDSLSIVVPVYNSEKSLPVLLERLAELLPTLVDQFEVILVNDASRDGSATVIERAAEERTWVIGIELMRNFGQHNALLAGIRNARFQTIVTMDDDLQNPPSEVKRLVEHARATGKDVVYTRYAVKQHAYWRNLGSRFANWVADVLMEKPKGLYLSSFRCMSAFLVEQVTRYEGPFPYVDGLIMQATQAIDTIEVAHLPRASGRSNYTMKRLVRLWLNIFVNFSVMPLHLSTIAGFALSLIGLIGVVSVVLEALFFEPPQGWASLMAATLLLSGVQLLILGILGEYMGRLFLTANRKPQTVVREVVRSETTARVGVRVVERA